MKNFITEFKNTYEDYEILSEIGRNTWQIRLKSYNKIAVLKQVGNIEVYKKLKQLNVKCIPVITNIFAKDGVDFIIEEYISGDNLSDILKSKGRFSANEVRHIVMSLCNILNSVHKAGIVHRDIKPSNIILTSAGEVYLIDFGIARSVNGNSADTQKLGTKFYASPEQYGFKQTDNRSDIYSIGKLIIVLLSGKETEDNINKMPFGNIIKKCIQVDADKRYKTAMKLKIAFYYKIFAFSAVLILFVLISALYCIGIYKNDNVTAVSKMPETALTDGNDFLGTENLTEVSTETISETDSETVSQTQTETETNSVSQIQTETTTNSVSQMQTETTANSVFQIQTETAANSAAKPKTEIKTETSTEIPIHTSPKTAEKSEYENITSIRELEYKIRGQAEQSGINYEIDTVTDSDGYALNYGYVDSISIFGSVNYNFGSKSFFESVYNNDENYIPKPPNTVFIRCKDDCFSKQKSDFYIYFLDLDESKILTSEADENGINIDLDGNNLYIPHTANVNNLDGIKSDFTFYEIMYYDIDSDGATDMLVLEEGVYNDPLYFMPIYTIVHPVKVNKDFTLTKCSGNLAVYKTHDYIETRNNNEFLIYNNMENGDVVSHTYKIEGMEVKKID